ncbi:MAG: threonine/serine exporter family protein [Firmicutes bacterium]|nr:threonine/serine exporter family protein [Bacillota bacterium]
MIRTIIFSGLTTVAFGLLYQVSGSTLWVAGLIGIVAWVFAALTKLIPGAGLLADFVGAFVIGALAEWAASWKRRPVVLFVVPAIISFVPGYLVYKSMVDFLKNNFMSGLQVALNALFAAAALSLGLALASSIFRPILHRARRARKARQM